MYGLQGDFFQHATDRNQIWRILLGLFVISVTYFIFIFANSQRNRWKFLLGRGTAVRIVWSVAF